MQKNIDDFTHAPSEKENLTKSSDRVFRSEYVNFLNPHAELVRNKFVYEKLEYSAMDGVTIQEGYLIRNRWIIRILSAAVICFSIVFFFSGFSDSGESAPWTWAQWFNKGSLFSIWGPLLLVFGASAALYQSFLKSPVLTITLKDKKYVIRIKKLEDNKTLEDLKVFLG